ncbi:DUF4234 domain-containing protein [Haloarchaeobius salinus]|uniref:DUF4234 domain-containing protein n=1 Tax=Haloarchaeobius salinus TaxID=1198298 RepID=UPI002108A669
MTDPTAFEQKSLGKQVLFSIVTFGLYMLYWNYTTAEQLDQGTDQSLSPILVFIPFVNLLVIWQMAGAAEAVTDKDRMVILLGWIFTGVLAWYWIQSGINDVAAN